MLRGAVPWPLLTCQGECETASLGQWGLRAKPDDGQFRGAQERGAGTGRTGRSCPHTVQSDTTRCGDSRVGHPGKAKHHLSILLLNNASEQYYITIG